MAMYKNFASFRTKMAYNNSNHKFPNRLLTLCQFRTDAERSRSMMRNPLFMDSRFPFNVLRVTRGNDSIEEFSN